MDNTKASDCVNTKTPSWIAIDWGTTYCRAWAIASDGSVLDESISNDGMANTKDFSKVYDGIVERWENSGATLALMAGMVGSAQGWLEAPYMPISKPLTTLAENCVYPQSKNKIVPCILPGICYDDGLHSDVMRGEEVQLLGFIDNLKANDSLKANSKDYLVCLPGTHSKWVYLRGVAVERFQTFFTGEMYSLLWQHSILRYSLPEPISNTDRSSLDEKGFSDGVETGSTTQNILGALFQIRSQQLLHKSTSDYNLSFLSGLLIGNELRTNLLESEQTNSNSPRLIFIGADSISHHYQKAATQLGFSSSLFHAKRASLLGLQKVYRQLQ